MISETTKPTPNVGVMAALHAYSDEIAIASITVHEVHFGFARVPATATAKRALLSNWIASSVELLPVYDYNVAAAKWHAQERARLEASGINPPFADGQIAAIAATSNLILVTRNLSDFHHYSGLTVISWFT